MKLSECMIGMIVEIIDRGDNQEFYNPNGCKDAYYIGYIIGLSNNKFNVIPKIMMASGETIVIDPSNIRPYCD
jgi:ABC-type uncharacterized transport system YnjBCD ATPase subunit